MSDVIVQPVQSWRDRRAFLNFAWELYRGDPHWVPPLRDNQKRLLGWKYHPFREISEIQTFLARRDGKVVGRIAAIVNHEHNHHFKERRGFFGFFEWFQPHCSTRHAPGWPSVICRRCGGL
jgi:hypothetical protein